MRFRHIFLIYSLILILFISWSIMPGSSSPSGNHEYLMSRPVSQGGENYVKIDVNVFLPYRYMFWQDASAEVQGNIQVWIVEAEENYSAVNIILKGHVDISELPSDASYEVVYDQSMALVTVISIPVTYSYVSFYFSYNTWMRYVLGQAYVTLYPNPIAEMKISGLGKWGPKTDSTVTFILPSYCMPSQGSPFPPPTTINKNMLIYSGGDAKQCPAIWYHSEMSVLLSIMFCLILLAIPLLLFIFLKKFNKSKSLLHSSKDFLINLKKWMSKFELTRFALIGFIFISILTISLAITVGPNPQPNILIMSNPDSASSIQKIVESKSVGVNVQIFSWWGSEPIRSAFSLSQEVDLIIVGDLPSGPAAISTIQDFMSSGAALCVLEEFLGTPLADTLNNMYSPLKTSKFYLTSINEVDLVIQKIIISKFSQPRLLNISYGAWSVGVITLAILITLAVFFASLLASSLIFNMKGVISFRNVLLTIACLVAVYGWTIILYITVSNLINLAVTVHAGPPDFPRNLVAVGFLGLGGGSLLRAVAGALGLFVTILFYDVQNRIKVNWRLLFPLVAAFLILITLPVTGPVLDDILLVGVAGEFTPTVTAGKVIDLTFSASTGIFSLVFSSPEISRGMFQYFFAGVAFLVAVRLSKNLRTIIIFILFPFFTRGLMRIGDLAIIKFLNTIFAGIFFGLIIIIILILLQKIYTKVTAKTLM